MYWQLTCFFLPYVHGSNSPLHCNSDGCSPFMSSGYLHMQTAFSHCQQIPGSSSNRISVKFYCAQGCGESDVDFWYRVIQFTPTSKSVCFVAGITMCYGLRLHSSLSDWQIEIPSF